MATQKKKKIHKHVDKNELIVKWTIAMIFASLIGTLATLIPGIIWSGWINGFSEQKWILFPFVVQAASLITSCVFAYKYNRDGYEMYVHKWGVAFICCGVISWGLFVVSIMLGITILKHEWPNQKN